VRFYLAPGTMRLCQHFEDNFWRMSLTGSQQVDTDNCMMNCRTTPHNSPPGLQPLLAAESGTLLSPIPENEVRCSPHTVVTANTCLLVNL
jgi:hypothetical protein